MGNTIHQNGVLQKGEGYRIISVQENGPFAGKVDIYFDFIIDVQPPEVEKSPAEILDKLSDSPKRRELKTPLQIFNENVDKIVKIKVVSTKYRKVRTIEVTPNNKWGNNNDLIGITFRKQRYDQVFDTFFPLTDVQNNSPIRKAGVKQGQYLIGCQQYPYVSIDAFMEGLYERFFDKENKNKNVHIAIYDISNDMLMIKEVALSRGWGGKGLLGCQFLQGMLNKFPSNLEEQRKQLQQRQTQKREVLKLRNELGQCDGASKTLLQTLQNQKNKKSKHYQNIKNLLNVRPPKLNELQSESQVSVQNEGCSRIQKLQHRVAQLESTLYSVKSYLQKIELQSQVSQ